MGLEQSPRSFAIVGHYSTLDGLKMTGLPVEKANTGKISSKKTVHHLPLSKRSKQINVAESYWGVTSLLCPPVPTALLF